MILHTPHFISIMAIICSLAACVETPKAQNQAPGEIKILDAYYLTPFPGKDTSAAYFVIDNTTPEDDRLIGVHTNNAQTAEIHNHIMQGDMMHMQRVAHVDILADNQVEFAPKGLHVMLFGLSPEYLRPDEMHETPEVKAAGGQIVEGNEMPDETPSILPIVLTLEFERAGEITVQVQGRKFS